MDVLPFRVPEDPESLFAVLERRAIGKLEDASQPIPPGLIRSFRIWHYPPAGYWTSWALFVPSQLDFSEGAARLRRLRWDADGDRERVTLSLRRRPSADPTLIDAETLLDEKTVQQLFRGASLHELWLREVLPSYARPTATEYGIEGYANRSYPNRVEWDRPVPHGLESIAAWHSRARSVFDNALV